MLRIVFLLILVIVGYLTFISPYITNYKKVTTDKGLLENLALVEVCKKFDENSHRKGLIHLKDFMGYYSNSFTNIDHNILDKMKKRKHKCIYYFRRILFRLHNDVNLYEKLSNSIEHLNTILDNYLVEASDRKGQYYFQMYS